MAVATPPYNPYNGAQVLTGARAILSIQATDPNTGKTQNTPCGIFNSVNWSVAIDQVPINVIGSLLPTEICTTGQEVVQINCSGFRVLNAGPYVAGLVPTVSALLNYAGITITIVDRATGTTILTANNAKCTSYRTNTVAKGTTDLEVSYMAIVATDESSSAPGLMTDPGAVTWPPSA